ncbi:hypothetical protein BH23ACT4_BH23ACT4_12110 [soil metagenome]
MSRFGDARWQRVAVWSGVALAWGSTITAVVLEPARVAPSMADAQVEMASPSASMPVRPGSGLLVIRYQPEAVQATRPPPPAPAPAAQPAPQTTSSGS